MCHVPDTETPSVLSAKAVHSIGIPAKLPVKRSVKNGIFNIKIRRMTTLNIETNFNAVLTFFVIGSQSLKAQLTVKCASCHHMKRADMICCFIVENREQIKFGMYIRYLYCWPMGSCGSGDRV